MNRGEDQRRQRGADELSAVRGDLELTAEQRLGGRRAEADDGARLDELDFGLEPGTAGVDFAGVRLLVNPPLPPRLPFEVFDDVGDVDR